MTLPHEKEIDDYKRSIELLKEKSKNNKIFNKEISQLEQKLEKLRKQVYSKLTAWERVQISRHPKRPHTIDYIENLCDSFFELSGDRAFGNDLSIIGGLAKIGDTRCMIIGQEKGHDTESRVRHNFGMPHPEGFRKALRLMKLAEKFQLPVVTFLDTSGASPVLEAEERGQGWAIAMNLREMAGLKTPIVVVVIGEGCSGGALGIGIGDSVGMLEHAYYTVISPEGCASILWKDPAKKVEAAEALKLNAENLEEFGIVDTTIPEPLGGAHHAPKQVYEHVRNFILDECSKLKHLPTRTLIEHRYEKYRQIGAFEEKQMKTKIEQLG